MKQLSFRVQSYISLAIMACAFLLGQIFKMGIFHNIGFTVVGVIFAINPVWPKGWDWQEHDKLKKGIRTGSIIVIVVFGLLMRYRV